MKTKARKRASCKRPPACLTAAYTNVAFRGIPVPPTAIRIEMRFDPPILKYSAVVSGLAWLLLAGFWWRSRKGTGSTL
jgi:hypothetical protein